MRRAIKFGLVAILLIIFIPIDIYLQMHKPTVIVPNNNHNLVTKSVLGDKAHVLSQKTIARLDAYNNSNSNNPTLHVYTAKSVPNNDNGVYLNQQVKATHDSNDSRGRINYLIVLSDKSQYVTLYGGDNPPSRNISTTLITKDAQKHIANGDYNGAVNQIIDNVSDKQYVSHYRTSVIFTILICLLTLNNIVLAIMLFIYYHIK